MMFENHRTFKTQFAGRELIVETGKTCMLSNGFLLGALWRHCRYGKCYDVRKTARGN